MSQEQSVLKSLVNSKCIKYLLYKMYRYDVYTYEHLLRTADLSIILGVLYGLNYNQLMILGCGSLLHDIGKCWIPIELLHRQQTLTNREYQIVQSHPLFGSWYLGYLGWFSDSVLQLVEQHHVNCDGSGYPVVNKIHPWSKIIRVADSYDAMVFDRVYQLKKTPCEALCDLKKHKDWYDNQIVLLLENWIEKTGGILVHKI